MWEPGFSLKFDGRDAVDHRLDMALLGRSMIGVSRIIKSMSIVAVEGHIPTPRQRLPLTIQTRAPQAHCYDLSVVLVPAMGVLPFAYDVLVSYGTDFTAKCLGFVLASLGGRKSEAAQMNEALIEIINESRKDHYRDAADARRYALAQGEQMLRLVDMLRPAARMAVAPVGPSCDQLSVTGMGGYERALAVDVAMADAIRAEEDLIVDELRPMRVRVDGLIKHTRTLKVEVEGHAGRYVSAEVRDPAFDVPGNVYQAAIRGGELEVLAKATFRLNGELVKLHIMDAHG